MADSLPPSAARASGSIAVVVASSSASTSSPVTHPAAAAPALSETVSALLPAGAGAGAGAGAAAGLSSSLSSSSSSLPSHPSPHQQQHQQPQPTLSLDTPLNPNQSTETTHSPTTSMPPRSGHGTPTPTPTNGTTPAAPLKALPHGAPARRYLNENVTPVLLEGMKLLAREQPNDPLRVLGEFLLRRQGELDLEREEAAEKAGEEKVGVE
ncbi:MAG: COMPASS (complex proteins associated with Set1p) component [Trizodia sp. TS-e1964]|nr:MAG: COMPASS (complex proteins associated with Set1p) component [Trizodia sp. TS-e1964]